MNMNKIRKLNFDLKGRFEYETDKNDYVERT